MSGLRQAHTGAGGDGRHDGIGRDVDHRHGLNTGSGIRRLGGRGTLTEHVRIGLRLGEDARNSNAMAIPSHRDNREGDAPGNSHAVAPEVTPVASNHVGTPISFRY